MNAYYLGLILPVTICGIIDFRKGIIPDIFTALIFITGLAYHLFYGNGILFAFIGGLAGFIAMIFWCYLGGMGGGDLKLVTAMGTWLGLYDLYWVLLIASALGVIWGIAMLISQKKLLKSINQIIIAGQTKTMRKLPADINAPLPKDVIPFGACLAVAVWINLTGVF